VLDVITQCDNDFAKTFPKKSISEGSKSCIKCKHGQLVTFANKFTLYISDPRINNGFRKFIAKKNLIADLKAFKANLVEKNGYQTISEKKERKKSDTSLVKVGVIDLSKLKTSNKNMPDVSEAKSELLKAQYERDFAFKMIGLLSNNYLKIQKENKSLKEKLVACR
jgi:putative cell wall-binding protein